MKNNYYKLEEDEINKIKEIEKITFMDYGIKGEMIETDTFIDIIEDLLCSYHNLEEEKEDLETKIQNDYEPKRTSFYEEYGISENDFH